MTNQTNGLRPNAVLPFLKWPGGKRWLAPAVYELVKEIEIANYYEPFLGGGAVFFALNPNKAILSDVNEELVNTYRTIKRYPDAVVSALKTLPIDKETYDTIRRRVGGVKKERCVRFLYLNRLAFGGMYRVNAKGEFNVPYGGGDRGTDVLWRSDLIKKASNALQSAGIVHNDFEDTVNAASKGDLVYCDPTYTVAHNDNGFRRYNESIFSWDDQLRLSRCCKEAARRGATVLVSNAAHSDLAELYAPYRPYVLMRSSCISRKKQGRRKIGEYLIIVTRKRHLRERANCIFGCEGSIRQSDHK